MREAIMELMAASISDMTGVPFSEITEHTLFSDLGMKSVNYSQLMVELENEYEAELSYMEFHRKKTIGEAVSYVEELLEE